MPIGWAYMNVVTIAMMIAIGCPLKPEGNVLLSYLESLSLDFRPIPSRLVNTADTIGIPVRV